MKVEITRINGESEIINCDKFEFIDRPDARTSLIEAWLWNGKLQHLILKNFNILDEYYYDENTKIYYDRALTNKLICDII